MQPSRFLTLCAVLTLTLSVGCKKSGGGGGGGDPGCTKKANGQVCATGADCCSAYCDNTLHCADACAADGAQCAGGGDCCSGFCNATLATPVCETPCTPNGGDCTAATAGACCTDICTAGKCASPVVCTSDGVPCPAAPGVCCSGFCDTALATPLCKTPCTVNGQACPTGAGACCSGLCDTGTGQCKEPCKENGASCGDGSECCTTLCTGTPKVCSEPVSCTADGLACPAPPGVCCSGNCESGTCRKPCTGNDLACDFNSDCCSGSCDATNPADKRCKPPKSCTPTQEPPLTCAIDGDCCDGYCAPDLKCRAPVSQCVDGGSSCDLGGDCCSLACNTAAGTPGTCTTTAFCGKPGAACVDAGDCCSLDCVAGVCSDAACHPTGDACVVNGDCCTGLCNTGGGPKQCLALPVPSGTSGCKTLGDTCGAAGDCCSRNCQGGKCIPAYACQANSDVCYSGTDCCSGMCDTSASTPGRCAPPSGGCTQDGNPCDGPSNCCTRLCKDLGSGVSVCQPASGCRMTGDYCDSTGACCGGSPDAINPGGYGVFCDQTGTSTPPNYDPSTKDDFTCSNGQACNPPGNICGGSGAVNASQNCCDGKKDVCKQDMNGIWRCFGGGSTQCPYGYSGSYPPPCCIEPGTAEANVCQFRDQCCNFNPCVPGDDGVLRCTLPPSCKPEGTACRDSDDGSCCAGTVCTFDGAGFTCEKPTSCGLRGDSCQVASDCCSNTCTGGVCALPCLTSGQCTSGSDCCSGYECKKENAQDPYGACMPLPTCTQTNESCVSISTCCDPAAVCTGGVCKIPSCTPELASCTVTSDPCCAPSGGGPQTSCIELNGAACGTTPGASCSCDACKAAAVSCDPSAADPGCCIGLLCIGSGAVGTCETCKVAGASCTQTSDCCPGQPGDPAFVCADRISGAACTGGDCICDACALKGNSCTSDSTPCCGGSFCEEPLSSEVCDPADLQCACAFYGG